MKIAIVGCGFVSYLYGGTLKNHPQLEVVGVHDRDPGRMELWCRRFGSRPFHCLSAVLESEAEIIVNLTNPAAHYEVTRACLEAGKHVYSEKPAAFSVGEMRALIELADSKRLQLSCAPCSLLGESAQSIWRAVRDGVVGKIHSAYVSVCTPLTAPGTAARWASSQRQGGLASKAARALNFPVAWPYADEFSVGCAYEHAAYPLKWLTSWFGPVKRLVNRCVARLPHKVGWDYMQGTVTKSVSATADLYVTCLTLEDDVEVVLVNSSVMHTDLKLALFGDEGSLEVANQWDFGSPVWVVRSGLWVNPIRSLYPHVLPEKFARQCPPGYRVNMDYARGIAELACAIDRGTPSPYLCDMSHELHIGEVTEHIARTAAGVVDVSCGFRHRPFPRPLPPRVGVGIVAGSTFPDGMLAQLAPARHLHMVGIAYHDPGARPPGSAIQHVPVVSGLTALLADRRVDLIWNVADPAMRTRITIACLRAKRHVVFAPPLAADMADANLICDLAGQWGLRACCTAEHPLSAATRNNLDRLRSGLAGEVREIRAEIPVKTLDIDVGQLWNEAAHAIWLASWTVGAIWRVQAQRPFCGADAEPGTLVFGSGATLHIRLSAAPSALGYVEFQTDRQCVRLALRDLERPHDSSGDASPVQAGHLNEDLLEACAAICEGRIPAFPLEHAFHQVEIREIFLKAMRSGLEVTAPAPLVGASWLPLPESR